MLYSSPFLNVYQEKVFMEYHEQNYNFVLLNIAVLRQKQATQWVRLLPALAVCIQ